MLVTIGVCIGILASAVAALVLFMGVFGSR
jgi:hypothetical protein